METIDWKGRNGGERSRGGGYVNQKTEMEKAATMGPLGISAIVTFEHFIR